MKRLLYVLLLLLPASCDGPDRLAGQDADHPLSECVLPESACVGAEVIIQWGGFSKDVTLRLVSADGDVREVVPDVVTDSGLIFTLPDDIPVGDWQVVLSGQDEQVLGTLKVTEAPESEDVPADPAEPEDPVGPVDPVEPEDPVEPDIPQVKKKLVRLEFLQPYMGTTQFMTQWDMSTPSPRFSEYLVEGTEVTLQAFDEYACSASGSYELVDGREMSNDVEIGYTMNVDGQVGKADVLLYGKSGPTEFTWEYDADGRIVAVSSPKAAFCRIEYSGADLVAFDGFGFDYDDQELCNASDACDVVWGYMAVTRGANDPFLYIPYLYGWYRPRSAMLPSAMNSPAASGSGMDRAELEYEFDEDGYVVVMKWKDGSSQYQVSYIYE